MGAFAGFALVPEQGSMPGMEQLSQEMQEQIRALAARDASRAGPGALRLFCAGADRHRRLLRAAARLYFPRVYACKTR